jgi:hypothetical protein
MTRCFNHSSMRRPLLLSRGPSHSSPSLFLQLQQRHWREKKKGFFVTEYIRLTIGLQLVKRDFHARTRKSVKYSDVERRALRRGLVNSNLPQAELYTVRKGHDCETKTGGARSFQSQRRGFPLKFTPPLKTSQDSSSNRYVSHTFSIASTHHNPHKPTHTRQFKRTPLLLTTANTHTRITKMMGTTKNENHKMLTKANKPKLLTKASKHKLLTKATEPTRQTRMTRKVLTKANLDTNKNKRAKKLKTAHDDDTQKEHLPPLLWANTHPTTQHNTQEIMPRRSSSASVQRPKPSKSPRALPSPSLDCPYTTSTTPPDRTLIT